MHTFALITFCILTTLRQKLLTIYLFQKALVLYTLPPTKELSPLFKEAEFWNASRTPTFDAIVPQIEYALGIEPQHFSLISVPNMS